MNLLPGDLALETRTIRMPTGLMQLTVEPGPFPLDELIGFAARANARRGFLFLSKVLGKHWPVKPRRMRDIHVRMAEGIPDNLAGPVVFIAMAETAIGLGQGVFEAWLAQNPERAALFLHTTRYHVGQAPLVEFAEAHSHAPRQFLHLPVEPDVSRLLQEAGSLVLIDDEASTGNTFLNLAAACRALSTQLQHVHLATVTNFMGAAATAALSQRFGIGVTSASVLSGEYCFSEESLLKQDGAAQLFEQHVERGANPAFGRLGITHSLLAPQQLARGLASTIAAQERVLVLGTGEFMHMAFLLGCELEQLGVDVHVQSTTRSPILQWGAVSHILSFPDNYGEGVVNYLYNALPNQYQHVFICHETPPNDALHQLARLLCGRLFHFLSENAIEEIPVR